MDAELRDRLFDQELDATVEREAKLFWQERFEARKAEQQARTEKPGLQSPVGEKNEKIKIFH